MTDNFNKDPIFTAFAKKQPGHSAAILSLCKRKTREIITGSRDTSIKVWNIDRGACLKTLLGPKKHIQRRRSVRGLKKSNYDKIERKRPY